MVPQTWRNYMDLHLLPVREETNSNCVTVSGLVCDQLLTHHHHRHHLLLLLLHHSYLVGTREGTTMSTADSTMER